MQLNFNELRELLSVLEQTQIAELTLKSDDFELTVRRDGLGSDRPSSQPPLDITIPHPAPPSPPPSPALGEIPSTMVEVSPAASAPVPTSLPKRWLEIPSPMVGTFYRSPAPDEPPFVEVGDRIRVGQTVCIIEAMKLMNELEAEISGEVVEILLQNGEPVEYGQPLMRVNPM